jgi:hypothetical protein
VGSVTGAFACDASAQGEGRGRAGRRRNGQRGASLRRRMPPKVALRVASDEAGDGHLAVTKGVMEFGTWLGLG